MLFSDGEREVAAAMPAGVVEFDCTLPRVPAPEVQDFEGTIEPIVDSTGHISGACVGQTADGLRWRWYLGQESIRRELIGADVLGEYAPGPGGG